LLGGENLFASLIPVVRPARFVERQFGEEKNRPYPVPQLRHWAPIIRGDNRPSSSATASPRGLAHFKPDAAVRSGEASPYSWRVPIRRPRSIPVTMLLH
jgi:hypothetical protein